MKSSSYLVYMVSLVLWSYEQMVELKLNKLHRS